MRLNDISINEASFGYKSLIGNSLLGIISARHQGKAEVEALAMNARKNFLQMVGRGGSEMESLTWNSLYRYLTIPKQLGLRGDQATRLLTDKAMRDKALQEVAKAGLAMKDKEAEKAWIESWGKKNEPIAGDDSDPKAAKKRADVVITHYLYLAAIKSLENKAGGLDLPDDSAPSSDGDVDTTPKQPSTQSPSNTPTIPLDAVDKIKQGLAKLAGGTT